MSNRDVIAFLAACVTVIAFGMILASCEKHVADVTGCRYADLCTDERSDDGER